MGIFRKMGAMMRRAAQRFNAESRAHRVLDKQKAGEVRPAPKYEANVRELERTLTENPELIAKLSKKDMPLDDRLKKVFVTSETEIIRNPELPENEARPLPLDRKTPQEFEFGYMESEKVPRGKISMRSVLEILNEHQSDPENASTVKFSEQYKVKEEYIKDILTHYKMLALHVNDPKMRRLPSQKQTPLVEGKKLQKDES